jgi:hypothetical protein
MPTSCESGIRRKGSSCQYPLEGGAGGAGEFFRTCTSCRFSFPGGALVMSCFVSQSVDGVGRGVSKSAEPGRGYAWGLEAMPGCGRGSMGVKSFVSEK